MICLAFSSNLNGLVKNATVIASVVRNTTEPVFVKFYCQGFLPISFECGRLKVEFIESKVRELGNYPNHVASAVFDRLQVIRNAKAWHRCLVMDHDMLALCDLAPYFDEDFETNLLMGRLFGAGNTLGLQMQGRGGLPKNLRYAESYSYFYMGPMMNLAAMRKEGTWRKLLATHKALNQDEQMALTIATEGRVKGVSRKWNLVPQWDMLEEGPSGPERSGYGTVGEAATWKNGLPEGVIHWTGWAKPWHYESRVWRPDLWESEETSWEALRRNWWDKPLAVLVEPAGYREVNALAKRGWKVLAVAPRKVVQTQLSLNEKSPASVYPQARTARQEKAKSTEAWKDWKPLNDEVYRPFPDLEVIAVPTRNRKPLEHLRTRFSDTANWLLRAELVRFGPGADAAAWLDGSVAWPDHLTLVGPVPLQHIKALRGKGYCRQVRCRATDWPAGGPHPKVLEYAPMGSTSAVAEGEEIHLSRLA